MLIIEQYETLNKSVECVQVTADNLEEVEKWVGGSIKGIMLPREERIVAFWNSVFQSEMRAAVGDWVWKASNIFWTAKTDHFKLFYRPAQPAFEVATDEDDFDHIATQFVPHD